MTSTIALGTICPRCGHALVSERDAVPWCESCEWNLDVFEPNRRRPELTWRWQDRLSFRLAFRMNARQYAELVGRSAERPRITFAGVAVVAFALALLCGVIAIAALGGYVLVAAPIVFHWFFGVLLLMIAVALRPRLGRLDKHAYRLTREDAPGLFGLIDEVASRVGTKPPHVVLATPSFNAYTGSYGLRRHRVLAIGMPLWMALSREQRVALLGHELGHFVNGDVRRGPITSMAFSTLGTLSDLVEPTGVPRVRSAVGAAGAIFAQLFMTVFHQFFATVQTAVTALALRSNQRAEYYADALAAQVGGTAAAVELMDTLMLSQAMHTVVRSATRRSDDVADWVAAAQRAQLELAPRVRRLRQLDIRDGTSLFRTHPPTGMRARMLESRPVLAGAVVLSVAQSARIDAELATPFRDMIRNT